MNRQECCKCLSILKVNYPSSFPKTRLNSRDANNLVCIWENSFRDYPYEIVESAIMDIIQTNSVWAPDVAMVKARIAELTDAFVETPTDQDLWEILTRAASNGYYGAEDEFSKLPDELKSFVGSPNGLREFAALDTDVFQSVIRGQFFRQIEAIRKRLDMSRRIPDVGILLTEYSGRGGLFKPGQYCSENQNTGSDQTNSEMQ